MDIKAFGIVFATVFVAESGEKTRAADPRYLSIVADSGFNATSAWTLCAV